MALADASHFDRLVDFLKQKRDNVTFHDIIALAEISAQSLQSFFHALDAKVYGELREIARYIESMRHEIGALQVNDLKNSRIPAAGEELGAIVQATEAATNTIMECAEAVMAVDASDPAAYKALVDEKMLVIFEACSFQDITGQLIKKVVVITKTVEHELAELLRDNAPPAVREKLASKEAEMMGGPSMPTVALNQDNVDDLLADLGF